jgi:hypothetical protein
MMSLIIWHRLIAISTVQAVVDAACPRNVAASVTDSPHVITFGFSDWDDGKSTNPGNDGANADKHLTQAEKILQN